MHSTKTEIKNPQARNEEYICLAQAIFKNQNTQKLLNTLGAETLGTNSAAGKYFQYLSIELLK